MRELSVSLNPSSIQDAIDALNGIKKGLTGDKMDNVLFNAAELIAEEAQAIYGPSVTVTQETVEWGKIHDVVATGRAVMFLEFGAGATTNVPYNPFAENAPVPIRPGSYSETHRQLYTRYGYWIFGGRIYDHVNPLRALYLAYNSVKPSIPGMVKREFE